MSGIESPQAMLERQLIQGLVLAIARASTESERQRQLTALGDLIRFGDPSLDATLFDVWTSAYLKRTGLYPWPAGAAAPPLGGVHSRRLPSVGASARQAHRRH